MRALFLLLFLSACTTPAIYSQNPHTGVTLVGSRGHMLQSGLNASFEARAALSKKGEDEAWRILTYVTRDDRNYPRIMSAWTHGIELPYRRLDRRRAGCGSGCNRQEAGEIIASRKLFEILSGSGLTFQLIGKRGTYTGHLPGSAFTEVLSKADG